jgi:hypothetical protein
MRPGILESQVEKMNTARNPFGGVLPGTKYADPVFWPVLVASREAMTEKIRDCILQIITVANSNCGLATFKVAT